MTALGDTQRLLAAAIDADALPDAAPVLALIASGPAAEPGLEPSQRIAIYRGSSRRARERALEQIYPVCRQVLGERCFTAFAQEYLRRQPSAGPDLNQYGGGFADHLGGGVAALPSLAGLDYLADLARLEWHWHAVYYAAEAPVFDTDGLAALQAAGAAERALFQLAPALRLLASTYPVRAIWQRHREGGDTATVEPGGERLVIRRAGRRPVVESVDDDTFALLDAVAGGQPLGALAASGLAIERLPQLIAARWITGWLTLETAVDRSTGLASDCCNLH